MILEEVFSFRGKSNSTVISVRVSNENFSVGDVLAEATAPTNKYEVVDIATARVRNLSDPKNSLYGLSLRPLNHSAELTIGANLVKVKLD